MIKTQYDVPLRWGDMDVMGHLNNVSYYRLMEEARIQWFAELGFPTLPVGEAAILAHLSCDFNKAMNYPGVARVFQEVTKVGRSSIEMMLRLERSDEPGVTYATGRSVVVWYDYDAGKSVALPATLRQAIT